jgi:hypothetical protein
MNDKDDPPHVSTPVNPFWKAVIVTGFLFVGTTLAIVMTPYGEQKSPVNIFLRKHGAILASIEVGAVLVSGVLAMALDQRQTRHQQASNTPPSSSGEPPHVG